MTDPLGQRIRDLLGKLMAAAPEPRPLPHDPAAGRAPGPRRRLPIWVMAPAAAFMVLLAIGLPVFLMRGGPEDERTGVTASTSSTVPMTLTDGTSTTREGHPSEGEGPENPMPLGESHTVGDWDITVRERTPDDPPAVFANPDGTFLVGVGITAARASGGHGDDPAALSEDLRFSALGADGLLVGAEAERCPHRIAWEEPAGVGATLHGNVCFTLGPAAADEVQLVVEEVDPPVPHRAYLATDATPEMACYTGTCPVRYLAGPELTREEFLATDVGQILEATFIGGDAEAENGAYLESEAFSIVSDSLVFGYQDGRHVASFRLEDGRVMSWGLGGGDAVLASGDLRATRWYPVTPLDLEATTVPVSVAAGGCAGESGYEVVTEIRFIEVVEDASIVQVVVWTADLPWSGLCAGVGLNLDAEVRLAAPLGSRALFDAGIFPAVAAGVTEEPVFPFHLYISNQSFDIDPVSIEVWVDADLVVGQAFEAGSGHNWILFELELAEGWHEVRAVALDGEAVLQESFYSQSEKWAVVDFWFEAADGPAPRFTWLIQDRPVAFL